MPTARVKPTSFTINTTMLKRWLRLLARAGCNKDCIYGCGELRQELRTLLKQRTPRKAP